MMPQTKKKTDQNQEPNHNNKGTERSPVPTYEKFKIRLWSKPEGQ